MDPRKFNSLMPKYNEEWAAKVLKMQRKGHNGIDIMDNVKSIEIKFAKVPSSDGSYGWTPIEYQMNYPIKEQKPCFWGLGLYYFNTQVSKTKQSQNLEKFVDYRELMIVNWDWINNFSPSKKEKYTYRYPKFSKLPEIGEELEVNGGKVFFEKNLDLKYFENIFKNSKAYYTQDCPF